MQLNESSFPSIERQLAVPDAPHLIMSVIKHSRWHRHFIVLSLIAINLIIPRQEENLTQTILITANNLMDYVRIQEPQ
jgi:hypothetical protein